MRKNLLLLLLILPFGVSNAQGVEEALRHSTHSLAGSTRALGSANAVGAIGGSATAYLINPATSALNRKSELHFGLNINSNSTNTSFNGSPEFSDGNIGVGLSNLNLTIFQPVRDEQGRQTSKGATNIAYTLGYNRTADYRSSFLFKGDNQSTSFTDFLAEKANGTPFGQLDILGLPYLGFETYLIEPKTGKPDSFSSAIAGFNTDVNQFAQVVRTGSGGDFNFSIAADIQNTVYIGGGLVIRRGLFRETLVYQESDNLPLTDTNYFASMEYNRWLETRVSGVGLNMGIMVKANENWRLGLSYVSPIRVRATDRYTQSISAKYDLDLFDSNGDNVGRNHKRTTPDEDFDGFQDTLRYQYRINTPGRLTMSAAYIFGKLGFISLDLERVNMSTAGLAPRNDTYLFTEENFTIKQNYKAVFNVRLGGELTYGKYRFRGGYALLPSTFKANGVSQTEGLNRNFYTAGIGYHEKNFSLSAAIMLTSSQVNYQVYDLDLASTPPPARVKNNFFTFQFGATIVVD